MTIRSRLRKWLKEHESTPDFNEKQKELTGLPKIVWIVMMMPMIVILLFTAHPKKFLIAPFYWFELWFNEVAPSERRKIILEYLTTIEFKPY